MYMADTNRPVQWNNLPTELLEAIGKCLNTKTDVSRFRAICKSWRSSIPPFDKRHPFPIQIIKPCIGYCVLGIIYESVVYHLTHPPNVNSDASSSSTSSSRGWLVKLRGGESSDQTRMLHPLSSSEINRLPESIFPKVVNLLELQVYEVARIYTLLSDQRVAISFDPNWPAIMVVDAGNLYHCKLLELETCTMVKDITTDVFKDVICYEGKFDAVCHNGTAVEVDSSLEMRLIASPISPDHGVGVRCIKNLVVSLGQILLVERYPGRIQQRRSGPGTFKIYKLNAVERQWVETKNLGDQILCVGDSYCFSVCAQDFPGCRRNCIYFSDPCFQKCYSYSNYALGRKFKVGVFNLGDGSVSPLPFDPGCPNMFCPTSTRPNPSNARKSKQTHHN